PPDSALPAPPPGVPVDALRDQPVQATAAPLLALSGGLVLLAVGVLVLVAGRGMPRLGARYAAPGARSRVPEDPDRAAWDALDSGRDPTIDPTPGTGGPERPDERGGHAPGGRSSPGDV
ncbi:MAG TPA: Trp biosynthesis-associated membrane protein, partial [Pseudonocardia sp.]|nr:Trp biosynthesis-associated membrane protein [Pseudonocardia sp.]